jgi:hypothetical protein
MNESDANATAIKIATTTRYRIGVVDRLTSLTLMPLVFVWHRFPVTPAQLKLMETGVHGRLADGSSFVGRGPTDRERFLYEKACWGVEFIALIIELPGLPLFVNGQEPARMNYLVDFLWKLPAMKNTTWGHCCIPQPRIYALAGQYIQ